MYERALSRFRAGSSSGAASRSQSSPTSLTRMGWPVACTRTDSEAPSCSRRRRRISNIAASRSASECPLVTSRSPPCSSVTYTAHQSATSGTTSPATLRRVCS